MTTPTEVISWLGVGWFADKPPEAVWAILTAAAIIGIAIIIVSYRFTLMSIPPFRRGVLCLLRFALWIGLLLILAAPTHIERTYDHPPAPRPLAVLVDRSDSMTATDNRQHRRLDDALLKWHRLEPAALKTFGSIKAFAFAQGMAPVPTPSDTAVLPGGRTDLFASLQAALAHAPAGGWGGIVTLTDGLDTSGIELFEAQRATARSALSAGTPLYFIVGNNRAIEPPFFRLREFNLPAETMPHSVIRLGAIFESYQTAAAAVPVQLMVGGSPEPAPPLRVEAGRRIEPWSMDWPVESSGTVEFELRAGTEVAKAEVRIHPPASNRILYEVGALDWGYRFLADILKRGDSFSITAVFDLPNSGIALPAGAIERMPLSRESLRPFGIVILANVSAAQIPPAQQEALTQWVREGGVVLFLTPDDDSTQSFAGSELEKMLPVVFMTPRTESEASVKPADLIAFSWEKSPRVREIFAQTPEDGLEAETPRFSSYAHVERAKPGAEVLARHPAENGPDGARAILLAVQRYGGGKSVVLTTDALWRWKLSESISARGVELFWENFFTWLNRDREAGFHFDHPPIRSEIDRDVTLHVAGAPGQRLRVEASLGRQRILLTELPGQEESRTFRWQPPSVGFWQIEARNDDGDRVRTWLMADATPKDGELSGVAPDEELLRALAAQTSGALLEETPVAWRAQPLPAQLLNERRQPLWHRSWLFCLVLGVYGAEMLLRRKWHLL